MINKLPLRAWHKEKAVAQKEKKEKGNHEVNRRSSNSRYEVLPICLDTREEKVQLIKANFE